MITLCGLIRLYQGTLSILRTPFKFANTATRAPTFRAEKRSAQASAHPLSQAQGGLFCVLTSVLTVFDSLFVCH